MKIGYARVSTEEQNLDLQHDKLNAAECDHIFDDRGVSGAVADRPGLSAALDHVRKGDVLVVWKLDRLGRSLSFLIALIDELRERGADFHSLSDGIDTTTAGGQLVFHIMGALAEFERALIVERTKAGMEAAKQRGKHLGRPRMLSQRQIEHARRLIDREEETTSSMAAIYGCSRSTLWRALRERL